MTTKLVLLGARLKCDKAAPGPPTTLTITPAHLVTGGRKPAAVVDDHLPTNIPTFGMCTSTTNPAVAADPTKAPKPCLPQVPAPWSSGAEGIRFDGKIALTDDSCCQCALGAGKITIDDAGSEGLRVSR